MFGTGALGQVAVGGMATEAKILAFPIAGRTSNGVLSPGTNNLTFPECPVASEVVVGVLAQSAPQVATIQSRSYNSASLVSAIVVNAPSGTANTNLLIAFCAGSANPAGFTPVAAGSAWTTGPTSASGAIFYKIAGASEPSSYTFNCTGSFNNVVVEIIRITGHDATTPVQASNDNTFGAATSFAAASVTATLGNSLLVGSFLQANAVQPVTPPSGMTTIYTDTLAASTQKGDIAAQTIAAGATGTKTWTVPSSVIAVVSMVVVNPGPATSAPAAATLAGFTQKYTSNPDAGSTFTAFRRTFIAGDPAASFALVDNGGYNVFYTMAAMYNHTAVGIESTAVKTTASTTQTVTGTTAPAEAFGLTIMASVTSAINQPSANVATNPPGYEIIADQNQNGTSRKSLVLGSASAKRTPALATEGFTGTLSSSSGDAWITIPFASGGTTVAKNLSVTVGVTPALTSAATFARNLLITVGVTPALTRAATYLQALLVTVGVTPTLSRAATYVRSLLVTVVTTVTLTKNTTTPRNLSVTVAVTPTITRVLALARSLLVTVGITPTLARAATYARTLSVTTTVTPTITRAVTYARTLSVTTTVTASLSRAATYARTLSVTTTVTATLSRALSLARSLLVTVGVTPTLSRVAMYTRSLLVTVGVTPTLTRALTLKRTLSVTTTVTPTLTRAATYARSLSVTVAVTAALTRVQTLKRNLSVTVAVTPTVTRTLSLARTLSVTVGITPLITRALALKRSLSVTVGVTATLTRAATYARTLTRTVAVTASLTRAQALARTLAVTTTVTATLTRAVSYVRTLAVTVSVMPFMVYIQIIYQSLPRIIRVDGRLALRVAGSDYIFL